ncbi:unannotated protein [freshwater metagenome]|uniref:Unannotated protein n=1 Tax=freshwater metagenome TaxID=449393 RepID=A0A6J7D7P2_9ZZZZ
MTIRSLFKAFGKDGGDFGNFEVINVNTTTVLGDEVGTLLPVGTFQRLAGQRPEAAQDWEESNNPKDAKTSTKQSAQHWPTLNDTTTALDDGGGKGVALFVSAAHLVALFNEGTLRHEVLTPSDYANSDETEGDAHCAAENPRCGVDPVGPAESDEAHEAQYEKDGNPSLNAVRVFRRGLHAGVIFRNARERDGCAVFFISAHWRSPTQNAARAKMPMPNESATNPSATGPSPPMPTPPMLLGF